MPSTTSDESVQLPADLVVVRISLLVVVQRRWFLDGTGLEPEHGVPCGVLDYVAGSERLTNSGAMVRLSGPARQDPGCGRYAEIPLRFTVRVSDSRWRERYHVGPHEALPVYVASSVTCWPPLRHHGSVLFTEFPPTLASTSNE